ncbi:hypothetical protein BLEM_0605 [Bifidobacterium lemurum]|uniref:Phage tail protein n=1 Tax=Bifidobacterium lemurum TaxID=1603886 RepID=A0A261FU91_9BIFI|nr:hypothetical protein [Bifidobacterium lemurum]OZG62688.1 hypothetical protein BLEM_0605 [Bifidobacterium lemurum]QOL34595.1 hypothetical protein BL8807_01275 [Bifidobacterium lemurum]
MPTKNRTLGPGSLTIGDTGTPKDFSGDCTNVTVTPDTSTDDDITYLDGGTEGGAQTTSWKLEGTLKEDYSADGLQAWCLEHAGETLPFVFVPSDKGTLEINGNTTIAPVAFGGDVKSKNDIDFSFAATDIATAAKA